MSDVYNLLPMFHVCMEVRIISRYHSVCYVIHLEIIFAVGQIRLNETKTTEALFVTVCSLSSTNQCSFCLLVTTNLERQLNLLLSLFLFLTIIFIINYIFIICYYFSLQLYLCTCVLKFHTLEVRRHHFSALFYSYFSMI
jgi:hypothetical protein